MSGRRQNSGWIVGWIVVWAAAFVIFPYFRGLFFYEDMIVTDVFLLLWGTAGMVGLLMDRSLAVNGIEDAVTVKVNRLNKSTSAISVRKHFFAEPLWTVFVIMVLFVTVDYLLMARFGLKASYAWDQAYRMGAVLLSSVTLSVMVATSGAAGQNIVQAAIGLALVWTGIFPLFSIAGLSDFPDAVLGVRLASVYQYPNTYGALVGAFLLWALAGLSKPSKAPEKEAAKGSIHDVLNKAGPLIWAWAVVPLLIGFVFSASRGAWVLWPLFWWLFLWLWSWRVQVRYLLLTIGALVVSLPGMLAFPRWQEVQSPWALIAPLALGMVYASGVFLLDRYFPAGDTKVRALTEAERPETGDSARAFLKRAVLPLVLAITGGGMVAAVRLKALAALLPPAIASRLQDISLSTQNVVERAVFYRDSLKLIREHWLFGAGGDAWRDFFLHYASYPYYSTQTHSFFFQLLIEVGVLGAGLFGLMIASALLLGLRAVRHGRDGEWRTVFLSAIPAFYLLAHGQIDFDFSYGFVLLLFFAWMSLIIATGLSSEKQAPVNDKREKGLGLKDARRQAALGRWTPWFVTVLSAVLFVFVLRDAYAVNLTLESGNLDDIVQAVETKAKIRSQDRETGFMYIDFYRQLYERTGEVRYLEKAREAAEHMRRLSALDPRVLLALGQFYASIGDAAYADELFAEAVQTAPLFLRAYEVRAQWLALRTLQEAEKTYSDQATECRQAQELVQSSNHALRQMREAIERERARLDVEPPTLRYPEFQVPSALEAAEGMIRILEGDLEDGVGLLEKYVDGFSDPLLRFEAHVLLAAAAERLGRDDLRDQQMDAAKKTWEVVRSTKHFSIGLSEQTRIHANTSVTQKLKIWREWFKKCATYIKY